MRSSGPLLVAVSVATAGLIAAGSATAQTPEGQAGDTATTTAPVQPGPESRDQTSAKPAPPGKQLRPSRTAIRLKGLRDGKLTVGNRIKVKGTLRPFAKGEKVTIVLRRGKKTTQRRTVKVRPKGGGSKLGKFSWSKRLVRPGRFGIQAIHRKSRNLADSYDSTRRFRIRYPDLGKGSSGDVVAVFNNLLDERGYVPNGGSRYGSATGRAVLAFRKVNGMARKESASSSIFKKLASGKGGFKLKHPGAGKHVEADLSRQVLVLAKGGKVKETYTTSSGTAATPTIQGKFRFYRKDPGYNSLGMYYSAYFIRGYATHGYHSVPNYPASHGCLRTPIPDAKHIYNWIDIGDPIYVYR